MATVDDSDTRSASGAPVFEAPAEEHRIVREAAGVLDRSERGKLALTGDDAAEFLNGQVSNEVEALAVGEGRYATLLTPKGRMLADLRILRPPSPFDGLWLDTERVALQALFDALRSHLIGYAAELHKHTLQYGLLSVIGPAARSVVESAFGGVVVGDDEGSNTAARVGDADVLVVATDLGVDVFSAAEAVETLRGALQSAGAVPVSEAAAECLRVESGRPRFGLDIDATTMPQEAGIHERAVSYTKGCYVGQETVARLYWKGKPNRHLRTLRLSAAAPPGSDLRRGDDVVGTLGSVAIVPELGPVALALVRREVTDADTLAVGTGEVTARVAELPLARA